MVVVVTAARRRRLGWLLVALGLLIVVVRADVDKDKDKDSDDDDDYDDEDEDYKWKIVFYTGDRTWAGTDSQIYFQVVGQKAAAPIQLIPSSRANFEVNSVDTFAVRNVNLNKIGAITGIVVGKQHSLAFFNDWQLVKVELYDNTKPTTRKYVFTCNCWLTTTKFKQHIRLESVGVHEPAQPVSVRGSKVFPLLVGLLLLLLILTMVSYFTNIVCKRWRELQELNADRDIENTFTESRLRRHRRQQNAAQAPAAANGVAPADRFVRGAESYDANKSRHDSADKPPEYRELFPATSTSKLTGQEDAAGAAAAVAAAVHANETTPIMQHPASADSHGPPPTAPPSSPRPPVASQTVSVELVDEARADPTGKRSKSEV